MNKNLYSRESRKVIGLEGQMSSVVLQGAGVDVLWGQPIKPIQVASNSELRENQWNDILFFEIVPFHCFGASEASKFDCFKD